MTCLVYMEPQKMYISDFCLRYWIIFLFAAREFNAGSLREQGLHCDNAAKTDLIAIITSRLYLPLALTVLSKALKPSQKAQI